jgi:DNA-binding YbaB/EbfC family protein
MGSGFSKRKKQAKELQSQLLGMQETMKKTEVTGSAGNGLVTVRMNGENEVLQVKINPECVDKDDIEGLEDLIKAALKDANKQLAAQQPTGIPGMSGLNFPGLGF